MIYQLIALSFHVQNLLSSQSMILSKVKFYLYKTCLGSNIHTILQKQRFRPMRRKNI